jgi:PAS domain S-box-containing protein
VKQVKSLPAGVAIDEVSSLIEAMRKTDRRLEELTAGEVDTVADRDGRMFLLQHVQDRLRNSEATKQAAILNALPAHIALLDTQGLIISVNEAWQRFANANEILGRQCGVGTNYLEVCDSARGDDSSEAYQVAEAIRSVLDGGVKSFSLEYPCHSPTEQRWFLLTVTPLADDRPNGAVVMHLNITERKRTQVALAQSEAGLLRAQLMAKLAHVITGPDGSFERWSESLPQLIGVEPAQLPRTTRGWLDIVHPDDRALFREKAIEAGAKKLRVELEYRLRRADDQWIHVRQTMEPLEGAADAAGGRRWFNTLQDVTEERQTEANLRASELLFRQMAENIRDVFFLVDADSNRVLYISPAYEEIWGRSCESLYANPESWTEAFHPDDRASTYEKYKQGMLAGKFEYEYRIVRPDGSIRWMVTRGFPIRDDTGKIVRVTGVAADITDRKQAAEELSRSESLKGAILESSLDCIIAIDQEGRIVEFNPAAEATFGLTREKALGQSMVDLIVPPRLRDAHRRGFAHYLATGKGPILGKRLELEAIRADGTEFPIELAITAIGGTSKPMFTGFIRDITERKRASDDLRESERRFGALLQNVELASVMLDREARITYCNEYLLRLTGWRNEEVIGRDWFEIFMPPEGDMKLVFAALIADVPEAWHHENEICTRSGGRRLIRWNNSVLRSGAGDVIGTASIGEDITERQMADEVLKKRAAELERFHRLTVGRELQMIELKKQINELAKQAGQKLPYDLAFLPSNP